MQTETYANLNIKIIHSTYLENIVPCTTHKYLYSLCIVHKLCVTYCTLIYELDVHTRDIV